MSVKECFGRVITDSRKLEECQGCEVRDACSEVQWGEESSGGRLLGETTARRTTASRG